MKPRLYVRNIIGEEKRVNNSSFVEFKEFHSYFTILLCLPKKHYKKCYGNEYIWTLQLLSDGWNASNDLNKIGYNHELSILKENVDR